MVVVFKVILYYNYFINKQINDNVIINIINY